MYAHYIPFQWTHITLKISWMSNIGVGSVNTLQLLQLQCTRIQLRTMALKITNHQYVLSLGQIRFCSGQNGCALDLSKSHFRKVRSISVVWNRSKTSFCFKKILCRWCTLANFMEILFKLPKIGREKTLQTWAIGGSPTHPKIGPNNYCTTMRRIKETNLAPSNTVSIITKHGTSSHQPYGRVKPSPPEK